MAEDGRSFGQVIRNLRERQGHTQETLAAKVPGLSQTFISQVEVGRIDRPSLEKMRELSEALNVGYAWLMVQAGYLEQKDLEPETTIGAVEADVLAFAKERPDLMAALQQLRDENTEEAYQTALRIVHRSIFSGIETAREVLSRQGK